MNGQSFNSAQCILNTNIYVHNHVCKGSTDPNCRYPYYYNAGVVAVNSKIVGLAPGVDRYLTHMVGLFYEL
jgi:hypothetical protein